MSKGLPESAFLAAPDPAFRVRSVSEYARIHHWLAGEIDFATSRILDFGCGQGFAAASFALRHPAAEVFGLDVTDVDQTLLEQRLESQLGVTMPGNLTFVSGAVCTLEDLPRFDLIYSWSVFEHIRENQVNAIFSGIKERLSSKGRFFLQIDPLYFSPRGSHLYKYFSAPWHHLLLSLDEIREVVFAADSNERRQLREWQQFVELNRLTATDFLGRARGSGFTVNRRTLRQTNLQPPKRLLHSYAKDALLTEEVMAVLE